MDRESDIKCDMTDDASKMAMEASKKADGAAEMTVVKLRKAGESAQVFDKAEDETNLALEAQKVVVVACVLRCCTGDCAEN